MICMRVDIKCVVQTLFAHLNYRVKTYAKWFTTKIYEYKMLVITLTFFSFININIINTNYTH